MHLINGSVGMQRLSQLIVAHETIPWNLVKDKFDGSNFMVRGDKVNISRTTIIF
jgi:hypothetical protein